VAALCGAQPRVAAIGVNCVPLNLVSPALEALRDAAGYCCRGKAVDEVLAGRSTQNEGPPVSPSGYSRWSSATLGSFSSAP
jgi:homocysteine S-methyltransferase